MLGYMLLSRVTPTFAPRSPKFLLSSPVWVGTEEGMVPKVDCLGGFVDQICYELTPNIVSHAEQS